MKLLYPGLRVKVVATDDDLTSAYVGMEGMIIEVLGEDEWGEGPTLYGLDIAPIVYYIDYAVGFAAENLEPILPDGLMEEIQEEEEIPEYA